MVVSASRKGTNSQLFAKPIERIDRSLTDINFPDMFLIHDQDPNFTVLITVNLKDSPYLSQVELIVYCRRTDEDAQPKIGQFSRSLGKSIGNSVRRHMSAVGSTLSSVQARQMLNQLRKVDDPNRSKPPVSKDINEWIEKWRSPEKMHIVARAFFRLRNVSLSGQWYSCSIL